MRSRIAVVAHVWPGITPMNVWDMRLGDWLIFAQAADDWVAEHEKANRERR